MYSFMFYIITNGRAHSNNFFSSHEFDERHSSKSCFQEGTLGSCLTERNKGQMYRLGERVYALIFLKYIESFGRGIFSLTKLHRGAIGREAE